MMAEQVTPNVFNPPCHKLTTNIQKELDALLKEYELQFMKDETSIGTTPLTSMTIDTGNSDPISQKPYPITMKHYQWVKEEIEKLFTAKVICRIRSSWSAPTGGSCLSHTAVKLDSCLAQIFVAKFLCIIKLIIIIG